MFALFHPLPPDPPRPPPDLPRPPLAVAPPPPRRDARQAVVWLHALLVGWEEFSAVELLGYLCLVLGTLTFNDLIACPRSLAACWPFGRLEKRSLYTTIG